MTASTDSLRVDPLDAKAWAELAPAFADHNYRQSWAFAEACAERVGATSEHVAVYDDDDLIAIADVRVRRLPLGLGGIAYVNGGPLVRRRDGADGARLRSALQALQMEFGRRRGLLLRLLAPIGEPEWNESAASVFREAGFTPQAGGDPYRTFLVDLEPDLEAIRKNLKQKWRNGLNGAEKTDVVLASGTGAEFFERFCALFGQFAERKQFSVDLAPQFYADVQKQHLEGERYTVTIASQAGEDVAGHVSSLDGDTCVYLLGATLPAALETKAAYLLQWHTIEQARNRGARWYDLGGIDPDGNPGVYRFKRGMNGVDVTAAGPAEWAPAGLRGNLPRLAESLYRRIRGH